MAITLEDLKKVRPYQLKALQHIHDTCEKYGLKYTLWGGTALGAVRHKGFIPWDVDVDVALLRPDFEKLKKIFLEQNGKGTGFFLQSRENTPNNYINFHPILKVDGTYFVQSLDINKELHHGIFVDIFPIDYAPRSKFLSFIQKKVLRILKLMRHGKNGNFDFIKSLFLKKEYLRILKTMFLRIFSKIFPCCFYYKVFAFISGFGSSKSDYITSLATGYKYEKGLFLKRCFDNYTLVPFEDKELSLISNFDLYLRKLYGTYMIIPDANDPIKRPKLFDTFVFKELKNE